ncbi:hypothetical protein ElyMa_005154300 [Elysia marginata]|uniref:FLYWCH-type domain-containing protein n=1 Tax=Elysia marginata TaxID=1093978 RepID=A0AAV4JQ96_9GAST|nr:hypothetical protein ElyMa_005154300 [Elysia marginata]
MEIILSQTNRGKPALIVDDFLHRLKTTTKSTGIWQCSAKKDCIAKITTGSDSLNILHRCTIHSHERDVKKIQTHTLTQACKRRAAEDTCERPRKILVSEARRDETSIQRVTWEISEERCGSKGEKFFQKFQQTARRLLLHWKAFSPETE